MTAKCVVVSAGAAGIGQVIASRFNAAGARVAICDADPGAVDDARTGGQAAFAEVVDVSDDAHCARFVAHVEEAFGGIDVLVNNAGVVGGRAAIGDLDAASWRRSFEVNVHGTFFLTKAVVPIMRRQGGGAIINISTASVMTLPINRSDYIASKWAIEGFTRAAARELGPENITVNALRPGFVDSERMRSIIASNARNAGSSIEAVEAEFVKFISMRTKIAPDEVADMAVLLTTSAARHVTGQLISVDGNVEWEP